MLKQLLYLAAVPVLLCQGCGNNSNSDSCRTSFTVSIEPQKYLLEQLAGDSVDVVVLLDNGANPETFEPSASKRMAAERSKAFFATGTLPFERTITGSIGDGVEIVNTSEGIEFAYGTHSHHHADGGSDHPHEGHDATDADPHVWTSVANARIMARNMADGLKKIDPDNSAAYESRLSVLNRRLDSIDSVIRDRVGRSRKSFAIWHPSLTYFARDYGLNQIAVGSESKEISARKLAEIIAEAKNDSVGVFFFQKEYDSRQAETINEILGSRIVTINPLSYEWEGQLDTISLELSK